jgi:urate oxidase / 2-oxo-4-hydroxy-4-carboxy-5-ureidoimidazoline decarboxylase
VEAVQTDRDYAISYGKAAISVYRTYARPLIGVPEIPESPFTGRGNNLFACEITVEVFGDDFLPAYTQGDNRNVVATDTMKNFVLQQALAYEGATLEGFLRFLGEQFLGTYPGMERLRLTGIEQPFDSVLVPNEDDGVFASSDTLFSRSHNTAARATLTLARDGTDCIIVAHECGCTGLELIKLTGSSFARFARDAYTTLPEMVDRPLFIHCDIAWTYTDVAAMLAPDAARYIPAEQVRDCAQVVFHQFVSKSIQQLVHEIGLRLLDRFPPMASVSFAAQNRLWDTAFTAAHDPTRKVYTDPRPPYGTIRLALTRASSE